MDISALKGIIPPLITPVTEDENIDEGALRKIVNHCIEKKLHGVFIGGTMGESLSSTQEQRDASIRIALDEAKSAIKMVQEGAKEIELSPQGQQIRKLQHELVEQYNLSSSSVGEEPNRRLKIFKYQK